MGQSTNGILAYGYDLGSADSGFNVAEVGEYGELNVPWFDSDSEETEDEEGETLDVTSAITRRLYESIPNAPVAKWDWDREKVVKETLGVWLEAYCSGDYSMWILTTHEITVYRGDTKVIDLAALDTQRAAESWDVKLAHALSVLGLTPTQEKPSWLLASYWG